MSRGPPSAAVLDHPGDLGKRRDVQRRQPAALDREASLGKRDCVEQGILRRVPYQAEGERQRHEYRLTEKGIDLYPTLVALMQWGDRYLSDGDAPVELEHRDCGSPVHLGLVCERGHQLSGAREVRPAPRAASRTA